MDVDEKLNQAALDYHEYPFPGKLSVNLTKPINTQRDISLAYTPGVASPVYRIVDNAENAYRYTMKGNLVAVITNGTAVLGLGNVGALAGKPVMEGKGLLFKHFADINVFDIEIKANNPKQFIETIIRISPTFGGINLEDISAPECFEVEQALIKHLDIPVFHDDQHGTAIIIAASLLNALELQKKNLKNSKIVVIGSGAAGIASIKLLRVLGACQDNILAFDSKGAIHTKRQDLNSYKWDIAINTQCRTLEEAIEGTDVVIGVSRPGLITPKMVASMRSKPILFALSNPIPEIRPEVALNTRKDLIIATGRSDYPNQVNNVLGFPFIFRGALDTRSTCINREMQIAAVNALRNLTHKPVPNEVLHAYKLKHLAFGTDYIIPKPLDPRLNKVISVAVGQAAIDSGVARCIPPTYR